MAAAATSATQSPTVHLTFQWSGPNQAWKKTEISLVEFVFTETLSHQISVHVPQGLKEGQSKQTPFRVTPLSNQMTSEMNKVTLPLLNVKTLSFKVAYDTEKEGNVMRQDPRSGIWVKDLRLERELVDYKFTQMPELEPDASYRIEMTYLGNLELQTLLVREEAARESEGKTAPPAAAKQNPDVQAAAGAGASAAAAAGAGAANANAAASAKTPLNLNEIYDLLKTFDRETIIKVGRLLRAQPPAHLEALLKQAEGSPSSEQMSNVVAVINSNLITQQLQPKIDEVVRLIEAGKLDEALEKARPLPCKNKCFRIIGEKWMENLNPATVDKARAICKEMDAGDEKTTLAMAVQLKDLQDKLLQLASH